jgi:hypothetical protein
LICLALLSRGKRVCDISGWDHDDAIVIGDNDVTRANRHSVANEGNVNATER